MRLGIFDIDKWQEIFSTMSKNKMRTFLTGFSVAWGIFMLIILLGSGNGLENGVKKEFEGDATNTIWVNQGQTSIPFKGLKAGRPIQFTNEDYEIVKGNVRGIDKISGRLTIWQNNLLSYKNEYGNYDIISCHPGFGYYETLDITSGRFINQEDIINLIEQLLKTKWREILNIEIKTPFPRLSYDEAMKKYNTDRPDLRKNKNNPDEFAFCWVVDFPLFEYSKEEEKHVSIHHPFTYPEMKSFEKNPKTAKSLAYDVVLNGVEIGGGSIRIHKPELQEKIFEILKLSKDEQKQKFGFLLDALKYGAPPHGGIALGFDRLLQILLKTESIRETIAFPKNKEARDLMSGAPSNLSEKQLKDVHITLNLPKTEKKMKKTSKKLAKKNKN